MEIGWSGTVYFIFWDLFSCTTFIPLTPSPQCPRLTVVLCRPFVPSPGNGFMFDQSHCFLHPLRRLYRVFGRHYLEFLWGKWSCKVHHVPPSADNQGGIGRASCLYVSYICCCWIFFFLFLLNKYYMCLGGFFKHPWKHRLFFFMENQDKRMGSVICSCQEEGSWGQGVGAAGASAAKVRQGKDFEVALLE